MVRQMTTMMFMYSKANDNHSVREKFEVKVGVHQGLVLSPSLFVITIEALTSEIKEGLPWEILYADDLMLVT